MYIILYIDCLYSLCDFDLVFKLDDSTKYTIKLPRVFKVYSVNVLKLLSFQNSDETTSKITPLRSHFVDLTRKSSKFMVGISPLLTLNNSERKCFKEVSLNIEH